MKLSRTQSHDLELALKIAQKKGFNGQAILSSIQAPPPPSGLGKMEPIDNSHVLEMQKIEINKLRVKIQELDSMAKLGKGFQKLPPLQPPVVIQ